MTIMKHDYIYVPCKKKEWSQYISAEEREKRNGQKKELRKKKERKTLEECFEFKNAETLRGETMREEVDSDVSYVIDRH